jgi:hypothetical protein
MKKWFAIPGFQGLTGRIFDIATVGQAAMVMQVVYEGDFQFFTNGQQVTGCVQSVIIFQGQTPANVWRQTSNLLDQTRQRFLFIAVSTTGMNINHIGANPFRHLRLIP